jgi:phosphopentomutase
MSKKAIILLLDSLGVGELPDAAKFGDKGSNTLLHIAEECAAGKANAEGLRQGPLKIPNLLRLGIGAALQQCCGKTIPNADTKQNPKALYGGAAELSYGKDTPSGHWEIAGVPVLFDWGYFPPQYPSFPQELVDAFVKKTGLPGILGNCHSSGTEIIKNLGDEHVKTGKPICYTSADSVFQIAAHEEAFGLERLYEICKIAYDLMAPYNIGRVIARPFTGKSGNYTRTENRRDYCVPPPSSTLLDKLKEAGGNVVAVGKISDIFAHRGISKKVTPHGNDDLFTATVAEAKNPANQDRTLIFTNFVDFDMKYGHRRDVAGYADALEKFDARLPEIEALLNDDDIVIITADHGCDPTIKGSDHTREYIPILVFGPKIKSQAIGKRSTFADIGQSLATYFGLKPLEHGTTFLP